MPPTRPEHHRRNDILPQALHPDAIAVAAMSTILLGHQLPRALLPGHMLIESGILAAAVVHRRIRLLPKAAVQAHHLECIPTDLLKWAAPPYPTLLLHHLLLQGLLHLAMVNMDNMGMVITAIQCLHPETQRGRDLGYPPVLFRWSLTCPRALLLVATDRPGRVVDEDSWLA